MMFCRCRGYVVKHGKRQELRCGSDIKGWEVLMLSMMFMAQCNRKGFCLSNDLHSSSSVKSLFCAETQIGLLLGLPILHQCMGFFCPRCGRCLSPCELHEVWPQFSQDPCESKHHDSSPSRPQVSPADLLRVSFLSASALLMVLSRMDPQASLTVTSWTL